MGGTGKSKVIQSINAYFKHTLQCHTLLILAPTEIATTNICENISEIEYVIIDEISMIGQGLFARFHVFVKKLKAIEDSTLFARLNILFVSNFMQLPSVLDSALYIPNKITLISSILNLQNYNLIKNSSKCTKINIILTLHQLIIILLLIQQEEIFG
ncbi:13410_t:CDS:2 [Cetraspora pellucida]|uniref:13410_t:CDS:1 n=1 Tax=Cetraspora pellucida TaxID=1433469 RepID=A0A9N9I6W0_9GLOM|nr:13410_t:CDS:2 [Cetraspora pellucida]